jgi:hypothetical protein
MSVHECDFQVLNFVCPCIRSEIFSLPINRKNLFASYMIPAEIFTCALTSVGKIYVHVICVYVRYLTLAFV